MSLIAYTADPNRSRWLVIPGARCHWSRQSCRCAHPHPELLMDCRYILDWFVGRDYKALLTRLCSGYNPGSKCAKVSPSAQLHQRWFTALHAITMDTGTWVLFVATERALKTINKLSSTWSYVVTSLARWLSSVRGVKSGRKRHSHDNEATKARGWWAPDWI